MDTLEEIESYCQAPNHVGALLLTGEWGCGKTYFVEHNLHNKLKDKYVCIRISLFGLASIEQLKNTVEDEWYSKYISNYTSDKVESKIKFLENIWKKLNDKDVLPSALKGISAINFKNFIGIENTIKNKTVVFIFDDLERCQISIVDVLGVINDYCENKKFKTIIVANENVVYDSFEEREDDNSLNNESKYRNLNYAEIKEKIIQRTICFKPNYREVITNIVENLVMDGFNGEIPDSYKNYQKFLEKNIESFYHIFFEISELRITRDAQNMFPTPNNLRSFKCAVYEFYRIYELITSLSMDEDEIYRWILNYIAEIMLRKANLIGNEKSIYDRFELMEYYPEIPKIDFGQGMKKWIIESEWNQKRINDEMKFYISLRDQQKKDRLPEQIIAQERIEIIDSDVLKKGFSKFLENAYLGNLTLDQYINFIQNCAIARFHNVRMPKDIDWKEIEKGIGTQILNLKQNLPLEDEQIVYHMITEDQKPYYTEDEWGLYKIIENFSNSTSLYAIRNHQNFCEKMRMGNYEKIFNQIDDYRIEVFDCEMANITYTTFIKLKLSEKNNFIGRFCKFIETLIELHSLDLERTQTGLECFRTLLKNNISNSCDKRTFEDVNIEQFIMAIDEVIDKGIRKSERYGEQGDIQK